MKLSTRKLCRSGIIAALYAALTIVFAPVAYGPVQIRPAEALTILPLFFSESIPGLFIGCLIANLLSPYGLPDIIVGSLTTLLAAVITFYIGKAIARPKPKVIIGAVPPVLLNAVILPFVWLFEGGSGAFFINLFSVFSTQIIFVYALGLPLYFTIVSFQKKGNKLFL